MRRTTPVEERFATKFTKGEPDECWLWKSGTRYAPLNRGRRGEGAVYAHRLAYEIANGPIPAGMEVDHICGDPRCVNPRHLRLATHKQNQENKPLNKLRGAARVKESGRWRAVVQHFGRNVYAGTYDTAEEAAEAARLKRAELFTHSEPEARRV